MWRGSGRACRTSGPSSERLPQPTRALQRRRRAGAAAPESWRTPIGPRMRPISRARCRRARVSAAGDLGDRLPGGGVDHHHGAAGEMRDPVGDVAEQETLASRIPELPTTTTSASARAAASRITAAMSSPDSTTARARIPSAGSELSSAFARRASSRSVRSGVPAPDASETSSAPRRHPRRRPRRARGPARSPGLRAGSASSERAKVAAHSTASAAPALPSVATATSLVSGGTERGYVGASASAVPLRMRSMSRA